jgi:tape measure domain-containing protein
MNNDNGSISYVIRLLNDQLRRDADQSLNTIRNIGRGVEKEGNRMDAVFKKLSASIAVFFTAQQATRLISTIARVRGEFQQLDIALSTMLQSREKANVLMNEIVQLAAKTPFSLKDAAQGAKQLLAYGSTAETVISELRMIGDVASGVSVPLGDLVYLYGTLRTQGRAYAMDIRQFAGRGIPIYTELAKVMGVAKDQVAGLVEAGKVGFPQVEKAFKNMTSQGGMFFNLMEKQSASLTGQIERLRDNIDIMFNEIGQSNQGIFNGAIQSAAYLVEHYKEIAKITGVLIATYGSYKVAVALVAAGEAARAKTLGANAALLGQSVKDELLATQLIRDKAIALQQEAIAEANTTKAKYQSLQAEVAQASARRANMLLVRRQAIDNAQLAASNLATAQSELAAITTTGTARQIATAQRKVDIAVKKLDAAQNQVNVASQNALAASQDFSTKKTQLQTTATAVNTSMKRVAVTTNAAMAASENAATAASARLTLAQHAQALSARISAGAQALLNATMLSNPIVATIAIVGGLVAAYFALRDTTTAAERAQERLSNSLKDIIDRANELKNKTSELTNIINDSTQPYQEQILRYKELQNLYPDRLKNLSLEEFKLKSAAQQQRELNAAASDYKAADIKKEYEDALRSISALQKKHDEIIVLEASDIALRRAITKEIETQQELAGRLRIEVEKQEEAAKIAAMTEVQRLEYYKQQRAELEKQLKWHESLYGQLVRADNGTIEIKDNINAWSALTLINQLNSVIGQINTINGLLGPGGKPIRTVNTIDDDIKKLKDERDQNSATAKQYREYTVKIKKLEEERRAITGEVDKKALAAGKKAESEREKLAKKQKELIEDLTDAERKATIDRMIEGEKQVAEIKARYDKMREALRDGKITDQKQFARIDSLEQADTDDYWYNQQTEHIKDHLSDQKKLYDKFEDYKAEYGTEAAKREFAAKIDVEKDYYQYVRKLYNDFELTQDGKESTAATMGRRLMLQGEIATGKDDSQQRIEQKIEAERQAYKQILDEAGGYYYKAQQLGKTHNAQLRALERDRTNIGEEEYRRRLQLLQKTYNTELKKLQIDESPIFKKLSKDITELTKEDVGTMINELTEIVRSGKMKNGVGELIDIPPEILARLNDAKGQLKSLQDAIIQIKIESSDMGRVAKVVGDVGQALSALGQGFSNGGNDEVGQILNNMGQFLQNVQQAYMQIANVVEKVKSAMKAAVDGSTAISKVLDSKDWIGLIVSLINVISQFFGQAARYRQALENATRELNDRNAEVYLGEFKITEELREQNRLQLENIELTKERIKATEELAKAQKSEIQKEADRLLEEIQAKGEYVTGSYIDNPNGWQKFWGKKPVTHKEYGSVQFYNQSDILNELKSIGYDRDGIFKDIFKRYGLGDKVSAGMLRDFLSEGLFGDTKSSSYKAVEGILNKLDAQGKKTTLTFKELKDLDASGLLEGGTKQMYDRLVELERQGADIDKILKENAEAWNEILTGTTSSSITDSIVEGFKNGKRAAADFADDWEGMMRDAMLNSLKYDYLEAPIQAFYEDFAAAASDGLSQDEIAALKQKYNDIITNAAATAENMEKITGISLSEGSEATREASQKGFASMSQDSANELNGRFTVIQGHTYQMNESLKLMSPLIEYAASISSNMAILKVDSAAALRHLSGIETNTARLQAIESDMRAVKTGIDDINLKGIKIKT